MEIMNSTKGNRTCGCDHVKRQHELYGGKCYECECPKFSPKFVVARIGEVTA